MRSSIVSNTCQQGRHPQLCEAATVMSNAGLAPSVSLAAARLLQLARFILHTSCQFFLMLPYLFGNLRISKGQDLSRQNSGVSRSCSSNGESSNGDPCRHLNSRKERVHALKAGRGYRYADDR